ncbi:MAG TPA: 30S ribosomal protein S1 [Candidatus Dormibacteraeota bacterium]
MPVFAITRQLSGPASAVPGNASPPTWKNARRALAPTLTQDPENLTMEELLAGEEHSIRSLSHGDIVDGTVVRVDPDEVLVDIGAKSEGVISNRELVARGEAPVELKPGDEVKVYVIEPENDNGSVVLSLRKARAEGIWQKAAEKESLGEVIDAEVREQNKGGLIVNIMGLRGFLPSSQVARQFSGNLMELVGTKIAVKILEVNRKRNRLIVSQRAAQDEDRARQREELFEKLTVGDLVSGKVSGLTSYGAFVNLGGADGLIHISELSWDRINNVSDMLNVGDDVSVKVIKLDPELSRISLSLRQMSDDPWDTIEDRFPTGRPVKGVVTKTKKYGAFLQIADGVEGLLHISELSWDHVERTEDVLKVGDEVEVMVLNADKVRRRISLSLRQLQGRGPDGAGGEEFYPGADYEPAAESADDGPAAASAGEEPAAESAGYEPTGESANGVAHDAPSEGPAGEIDTAAEAVAEPAAGEVAPAAEMAAAAAAEAPADEPEAEAALEPVAGRGRTRRRAAEVPGEADPAIDAGA